MATNKRGSPYLPLTEPYATDPYAAAGCSVDKKTGLVSKSYVEQLLHLEEKIFRQLAVYHEVQRVNTYVWYNLPNGLDGKLIERILFYKGQGIFWYNRIDEKFYFLPFTLSGNIDVYGRYLSVTPLPFNGQTSKEDGGPWLVGLKLTPVRDIEEVMNWDDNTLARFKEEGAVILLDYTQAIPQYITPRSELDTPLLKLMSEILPFARTSLIANSGIKGMRVNDQTDASQVTTASKSMTQAALEGNPFIPIVAQIDFQDLTSGTSMKSEEYLLFYQALDNLRKSFIGIPSSGIYEKKAHILESEQDMNCNSDDLILQDGLLQRQNFCDIVNAIWGLGIWCEASEAVVGVDKNMDGETLSEVDQSGEPGEQPKEGEFDE